MEKEIYSNKQVAEITKISPRNVLAWSEKSLINAFIEPTGSGTKRGYDDTNLLEYALSKKLFSLGFGFRAVKKMLNALRDSGMIRDWANDFTKYFTEIFESHISHINKQIKEEETHGNIKAVEILKEFKNKFLQAPLCPDKHTGVLAYFFGEEKDYFLIIPWDMDYVINLDIIKEAFKERDAGILIDIGKIRKEIDSKI